MDEERPVNTEREPATLQDVDDDLMHDALEMVREHWINRRKQRLIKWTRCVWPRRRVLYALPGEINVPPVTLDPIDEQMTWNLLDSHGRIKVGSRPREKSKETK